MSGAYWPCRDLAPPLIRCNGRLSVLNNVVLSLVGSRALARYHELARLLSWSRSPVFVTATGFGIYGNYQENVQSILYNTT
jgi:hypothetical protein